MSDKSAEDRAQEVETGPFAGWLLTPKQQTFLELCWSDAAENDRDSSPPASQNSG
ncbi:hypothetical protein Q3V30_16760 [Erwinia pyri]|uniref:Uncharacterized protein n=1 Tax=Erwinia pyri TaxID=3062598 RepID=A0AA50DHL9_9GAMM|nr:hypothetical protein [Erwinia sp. DE2]WLS78102.1 hypothetical protein Q3V30_16760 [Erwinia sp. DE2]